MIPQNTIQKLPGAAFAYLLFVNVIVGLALLVVALFVLSLGAIHGTMKINGVTSPTTFSAFWPSMVLIVMGILIPLYKLLWCSTFSFFLTGQGVTINSGVVMQQSKTINFDRIQNVDNVRGPIEMLFGITSVNIWTASQDQFRMSTTVINGIPRSSAKARPEGRLYLLKQDAEDARDFMSNKGAVPEGQATPLP